jgi:hypothetical protein
MSLRSLLARVALVASAMAVSACGTTTTSPTNAPTSSAAEPRYRAVHIDTIQPGKLAQFEGARREWVAELLRDRATDGRGLFVQVGDSRFFTLRAFSRFGDFDTRGAAIERSLSAVPKAAAERYDELSDTALAFPHTSEIWTLEPELSYALEGSALTERAGACGRVEVEDVQADTDSEKRYEDAVKEINAALRAARYPLTRLTFTTRFGAGHVYTFWLARSPAELAAAPEIQAAVAAVKGAARASELAAAQKTSVVHAESWPIVVRHDLTQ